MFAAARQRVRMPKNVHRKMLRQRRRIKTVTASVAASLHEELVANLTGTQLERLEREFKTLDEEGFGFIRVRELITVCNGLGCEGVHGGAACLRISGKRC